MADVPSEYAPVTPPVSSPTTPPAPQQNPSQPPVGMPKFPDGSSQAAYRQTGNPDRTINWVIFALPIALFLIGILVIFIVFSTMIGNN